MSKKSEPNYNSTFRERVGYKLLRIDKAKKIILILLGNIYGIIYRWGSNMGTSYLLSYVQAVFLILSIVFTVLGRFAIPMGYIALLIIDFLCVIFTDDIRFLGRRHYKNFKG